MPHLGMSKVPRTHDEEVSNVTDDIYAEAQMHKKVIALDNLIISIDPTCEGGVIG